MQSTLRAQLWILQYRILEYVILLSCLVENRCLPVSPMDGICLAEDSQADKSLVTIDQINGQWWVLKGLNCGQDDIWRGGFDYFPCQYDYFLPPKEGSGGQWTDHISFCGGECQVFHHFPFDALINTYRDNIGAADICTTGEILFSLCLFLNIQLSST